MADLLSTSFTNDTKIAFVATLRAIFGSTYLAEYKYDTDPRVTKILIQKEYPQIMEEKPAILVSSSNSNSDVEFHNEEEIEDTQTLSNTKIATNNPTRGSSVKIYLTVTTGFVVGDAVIVEKSGIQEQALITAIDPNVSVTIDVLQNNYITPNISKLAYIVKHHGGQDVEIAIKILALSDIDRDRISDFVAFSLRFLFRYSNALITKGIAYNKIRLTADSVEDIKGKLFYSKIITIPCYTEFSADLEVASALINLISKITVTEDII